VIDVPNWVKRYGARVDSWRLPTAQAERQQLARGGYAGLFTLQARSYLDGTRRAQPARLTGCPCSVSSRALCGTGR